MGKKPCKCYYKKFHCSQKECDLCDNEEGLNKMFCGKDNLKKLKEKFFGN